MKLKFKFFTALSLLLIASAWAGKWTIDSFDDSPDPGDPDNFITGDLKPVTPDQVSQQSGTLYVRQKFEDTFGDEGATYQIFRGRPTEAAKSLGKISLDGIPYTTLLKMKLFYKKTATGDDDLETVYFDGKDIFVEGEDPVFINLNGKMEELKPMASKDYKISITTEPAGATVTVNNANKGSTPVTFNVTSAKTITAIISKEGYYTIVKPIAPSTKQATTQEGILLTARKPLENPATAYKSQLQSAMSSRNSSAVKNLRADVQKTLNNYNSDSKKSIETTISKFPANPPKASDESSGDYSARQTIWTNSQTKERETLNKEAQSIFNELKDLLAEIDAAAKDLESAPVAVAPKKPPPPPVEEEEEEAEYDEDADEEEVSKGVATQEKYDYSRYGAAGNATEIFGNTDEYLFWTGMVFLAGAIGTGVVGFLQNSKYLEASDAIDKIKSERRDVMERIEAKCRETAPDNVKWCKDQAEKLAKLGPDYESLGQGPFPPYSEEDLASAVSDGRPLYILNHYESINSKTQKSYNQGRLIFFGAAGLSLAISIILFAW